MVSIVVTILFSGSISTGCQTSAKKKKIKDIIKCLHSFVLMFLVGKTKVKRTDPLWPETGKHFSTPN